MDTTLKQAMRAIGIALVLAGCGGGGGGDSGGGAPTSLTLGGTAATGAAIANAAVSAKCSAGSGSATTAANGSYSITITGGSLPCVIEVTPAAGAALHSVIDGVGGGAVNVNVTPLTELITARIAAGAPSGLYSSFDAAAQARITPAAVSAAVAAIASALQGLVDLAGSNPIKDTLVAGNPLDQKLEALKSALAAAQVTLADVVTAFATSGTSTASVATILQPATASCAGFRSGKYRVINPHEVGHDPLYVAHLITVDAVAQTLTDDLDPSHTALPIVPVAGSPCKFTVDDGSGPATVLVSRSGVSVVLAPSSTGQTLISIVVPEQNLPVAELAGTWNYLQYIRDTTASPYAPGSGTVTIDGAGTITAGADCTGLNTCTPFTPPFETVTANATGGFNVGASLRAFAFKTSTGKVSFFLVDQDNGGFSVATQQSTLGLPAVGDVSRFYDFSINASSVASVLSDTTETVKTVDSAAASYTRERLSDGRIDGFTINQPRPGVRHRAAGTSPIIGGGTVSFTEILVISPADTGVSVYTSVAPAQNFFGVSIGHP